MSCKKRRHNTRGSARTRPNTGFSIVADWAGRIHAIGSSGDEGCTDLHAPWAAEPFRDETISCFQCTRELYESARDWNGDLRRLSLSGSDIDGYQLLREEREWRDGGKTRYERPHRSPSRNYLDSKGATKHPRPITGLFVIADWSGRLHAICKAGNEATIDFHPLPASAPFRDDVFRCFECTRELYDVALERGGHVNSESLSGGNMLRHLLREVVTWQTHSLDRSRSHPAVPKLGAFK